MNRALKAMIVLRFGTQDDFARVIGENPSIVSKVIRGRHTLAADKKSKWASALQIKEFVMHKFDLTLFPPKNPS